MRPQKANVCAGIIGNRILVLFNNNFNGAMYLTFVQEDLIPVLAALFPNTLDQDLPPMKEYYYY
jgi:hypothetical protein